jgi:hypothetical protein
MVSKPYNPNEAIEIAKRGFQLLGSSQKEKKP